MQSPCKAPFLSMTITPDGKVAPCCAFRGPFGDLNDMQSVYDGWLNDSSWTEMRARELKGQWTLPGCTECVYEQGKVQNRKEFFDDFATQSQPFNPQRRVLKYLDISFGNTCNLSCIMCKSEFSTTWIKNEKEFVQANPWRVTSKPWSMSYKQIDALVAGASEVEVIEIKGGEPLFDKKFKYFLEQIIKVNRHCKIILVTNFTIIDTEVLQLLAKIRDFEIVISIDGVGKTYEWIRGFSFAQLEDNFNKYLKMAVSGYKPLLLQFTSSVYNLDNLVEFWDWTMAMGERLGISVMPTFGLIATSPSYISPLLVKDKNKIVDKITDVQNRALAYPGEQFYGYWPSNSKKIVRELETLKTFLLENSLDEDAETWRRHEIWHQHLVKLRGWDFYGTAEAGKNVLNSGNVSLNEVPRI